jgi:effector-binding domain-containing protein
MVKFLKFLLYTALTILVVVIALGLFGKKDYRIVRSISIDAPSSMVFDYVRHLENFKEWSPWTALDPTMQITINGTDGEVGASYRWSGNDKAGEGSQTIIQIKEDQIILKTDFIRPFESTSETRFDFSVEEGLTKVSWVYDWKAPFPLNGLMMLSDIDAALGKDFVMGLENLERILEGRAHRKYLGFEVLEEAMWKEKTYVGFRQTVDTAQIGKAYSIGIQKTLGLLAKGGVTPVGAATALYWSWEGGKSDFMAAFPVDTMISSSGLATYKLGGRKAYMIEYKGAYERVGTAHAAMDIYCLENGLTIVPPAIEEYVVGPQTESDTSKWLTRVIYFADKK